MAPGDVCHGPRCSLAGLGPAALEYRSCHWPGGSAGSPKCVQPMGCWFFPVPQPPYVCAVSWASRLLIRTLSVEEVDTQPVKRKREREKDAGESITEEGEDQGHDPTNDPTFEGAPSASDLHASPSPITTTLPTRAPAAATSTPITNPPMAQGRCFTGMPTYPAHGVNPPTTAFPEATTTSELVTSSYAPRWYAADYHHPLPATGASVDVPGYATLSGLRRRPESCGGRSRG